MDMDQDLLSAFFEDVNDLLDEWVRVALALKSNDVTEGYTKILRAAHNLKGSAGLIGLMELHATMHKIEDHIVKLRSASVPPDAAVVAALLDTEKKLQHWVTGLKTNPNHIEDTSELDVLWSKVISHSLGQKNELPIIQKLKDQDMVTAESSETVRREKTLRVAVSKLDRVIQLVGEISLHHAILERSSREGNLSSVATQSAIEITGKLTKDLQDAAMSLRMVPVEALFQRIERVVRETATHLNRMVKFTRKGGDVTLDKLIVEGMIDPLIHLARNAVDHGIEPAEDRVLANKIAEGTIHISADNTAGGVVLTFTDDGRGIDANRVHQKAIQMGLVSKEESLSDTGKLQLIFLPGLSTAKEITELSGRGVGMDVVAESVKRMGGRIEIESATGSGTTITIQLPTNLSIIDALVVRVDGIQYAIPNQNLLEVIDLREYPLQKINGGESQMIDVRGKIVPVEDLRIFLGEKSSLNEWQARADEPKPSIIVQHLDEWLALAIESVVGQEQIFVRPALEQLTSVQYFDGSTILSDGEPTIILNLAAMAQQYFRTH